MTGSRKVNIDAPQVTEDEAQELMFYHLGMAAAYFAASPEDLDQMTMELDRIFGQGVLAKEDVTYRAARSFMLVAHQGHEDIRKELGGNKPEVDIDWSKVKATGKGVAPAMLKDPEPPIKPTLKLRANSPRLGPGEKLRPMTTSEQNLLDRYPATKKNVHAVRNVLGRRCMRDTDGVIKVIVERQGG